MDLLRARPVSRNEDDGLRTTYECQACLEVTTYITDPYDTKEHVACPRCGYQEGADE